MMSEKSIVQKYLADLRKTRTEEKTEHTDRAALQLLLERIASVSSSGIGVHHEPKRAPGKGAPDFKVTKGGLILGYVETKPIGEDLEKVLKSDQLKRYRGLSRNILLTDYLRFRWINPDGIQPEVTLCSPTDLENAKFSVSDDRVPVVVGALRAFLSKAPDGIASSRELALAMAIRSKLLRDYLADELIRQERSHTEGRLYGLYRVFRGQVFHELTLKEFADAFAQMLAYGLFLARLNSGDKQVTLHNARQFVPGSFRLIRELVDFLAELDRDEYREVRWVIEEVLSIVNGLEIPSIYEDLSFRQRRAISSKVRASDEEEHRLFERDPFIYFYEDYLKAYDPAMRKGRGVYYTPPPIVSFIVRAIDDLLKDSFGIQDGLADFKRVTVLDFACGTGTFLLEAFERVFDNVGGPTSGHADLVVREHLLRNLFGFEYLIAPYTIAHLKLSQYLKDKGHPLTKGERLQVFLTNTLEPIEPQKNFLLPAVTAEVAAAQRVKDREILVITGNPPYSGHSKNKGKWITSQITGYKFTLERDSNDKEVKKPLGERNPKWLNDDYVKFIRFAQLKMDAVEEGIVGIITNHSWLDNPTFRGMRQSLSRSFEQIYILDLHGSTKPKEPSPDGVANENVFDIQKGVAISLLVKKPGAEKGIWFAEMWGSRLEKYKATAEARMGTIKWNKVECFSPYYMFRDLDWAGWKDYGSWWQIGDSLSAPGDKVQIFGLDVLGFQTHRDKFAISFSSKEMRRKLRDFGDESVSDATLTERYGLKSNRDWNLQEARAAARSGAIGPIRKVAYRPFDDRWSEFSKLTMDFPRRELLDHVAGRENLCLLVSRQVGSGFWRHAFVTTHPANDCVVSDESSEANQVFPLFRYDTRGQKHENLSASFRDFLDTRYAQHFAAEEVIGYIYAVLHAPTYRARYAEFLRIDFPRIPFPQLSEDFEKLSVLGWGLIQAHLLRDLPRRRLASYKGKGDHVVELVRYRPSDASLFINQNQCFRPVPQNVWDFCIGSHRVLEKYLKSRTGRSLSLDEINHLSMVADSLAFTVKQMGEIDNAYRAAFEALDN